MSFEELRKVDFLKNNILYLLPQLQRAFEIQYNSDSVTEKCILTLSQLQLKALLIKRAFDHSSITERSPFTLLEPMKIKKHSHAHALTF